MAGCELRDRWQIAAMVVIAGLTSSCCGSKKAPVEGPSEAPAPAVSIPPQGPTAQAGNHAGSGDPALHKSFAQATLPEPPEDVLRPPDVTMTGKSVGKFYREVVEAWDQIKFVGPGKNLAYKATLDTELGTIEIALRPDWAPNHVRSFLALAKVGYYDGLVFERCVNLESDEAPTQKVELIEAGCPLGTGEIGGGSIGYWLRPELNPQLAHEEGVVGATHDAEADTAACKFYIMMGRARSMDGNFSVFGKVTKGLDVARKIFTAPVRTDDEYPDGDRPVQPVVIRKVVIEATDVEKVAAN